MAGKNTISLDKSESVIVKKKHHGKNAVIAIVSVVAVLVGALLLIGFNTDWLKRGYREVQNLLNSEVDFPNGQYTGNLSNGNLTGNGTFSFKTGEVYTGSWSDNDFSGDGELQFATDKYTGQFSESEFNGQGTYTWENGDSYEGQWLNGAMNGEGTYTFADGVAVSGKFSDNVLDTSYCTITFPDGTVYSGRLIEGKISGSGTMTYPNGDKYAGAYKNGKRNGKGTYIWKSGDQYDGNWIDDAMSGDGTYSFADGSNVFGKFKDNKYLDSEKGKYIYTTTSGDSVTVDFSQISKLKEATYTVVYSNGDSYTGTAENGKWSGKGKYTWKSGASYDGEWSDGTMNGSGTLYYAKSQNGYKLVGTFKDGKPTGVCTYYSNENNLSESYKTTWENGKCVKVD